MTENDNVSDAAHSSGSQSSIITAADGSKAVGGIGNVECIALRLENHLHQSYRVCLDLDDECKDARCPRACWQHDPTRGLCTLLLSQRQ